ncbi:MAG: 2-keto-4-pentenoate hydratase [Rhodospirillales bacterium]|nr:2-keto-4-pentenoate hydratase [Rhodospirillales bacterium]
MTERSRTDATARLLLDVRAGRSAPLNSLPNAPANLGEALAVQKAVLAAIGPVGAWKVGAPKPEATPFASPLPVACVRPSDSTVNTRLGVVEGEICFRLGRDLPPRSTPYDAQEVFAAIGACMAAIEVLDSRFTDYESLDMPTALADLQHHGALIVGEPASAWTFDMFASLDVEMSITDQPTLRAIASNPAGTDLARLLLWLANSDVARELGGLLAGQYVTTGSWTGKPVVPDGGRATVRFPGFPPVTTTIARTR